MPDNVFRYHVRSFEADETGILIELWRGVNSLTVNEKLSLKYISHDTIKHWGFKMLFKALKTNTSTL